MHPSLRTLDRYLSDELSPAAAERVRRHLLRCARCRERYDAGARLSRALSGDPDAPAPHEDEHQIARALRAVGAVPGFAPRQPFWRVRRWQLATCGAAGLLLCGIWLALVLGPAGGAGRLIAGQDVRLGGVPVSAGETELSAGVPLEVGGDGLAELELSRGGRVRVFPDTRLVLEDGGAELELLAGRVWCQVEPGRGAFAVRTEAAEVRVLGTSFVVEQEDSGATEVRVVKGTVEVRDRRRRGKVRLEGGFSARVQPESAPSEPRRFEGRDAADWERFWHRVGNRVERGLDKGARGVERAVKKTEEFFRRLR